MLIVANCYRILYSCLFCFIYLVISFFSFLVATISGELKIVKIKHLCNIFTMVVLCITQNDHYNLSFLFSYPTFSDVFEPIFFETLPHNVVLSAIEIVLSQVFKVLPKRNQHITHILKFFTECITICDVIS